MVLSQEMTKGGCPREVHGLEQLRPGATATTTSDFHQNASTVITSYSLDRNEQAATALSFTNHNTINPKIISA